MHIPVSLYTELDDNEVLRFELMNGTKIYYLPSDIIYVTTEWVEITKPIKKDKKQRIIIDVNAIAVVCTMSRQTYELKLQRGELYV